MAEVDGVMPDLEEAVAVVTPKGHTPLSRTSVAPRLTIQNSLPPFPTKFWSAITGRTICIRVKGCWISAPARERYVFSRAKWSGLPGRSSAWI